MIKTQLNDDLQRLNNLPEYKMLETKTMNLYENIKSSIDSLTIVEQLIHCEF